MIPPLHSPQKRKGGKFYNDTTMLVGIGIGATSPVIVPHTLSHFCVTYQILHDCVQLGKPLMQQHTLSQV